MLKQALMEARERELASIPNEEALRQQYTFSDSFEQKMAVVIRKTNHRYVTISRFTMRRVFVAIIVAILLLTGCMSVKEIREPLFNFFIKDYGKFSRITFEENPASQEQEGTEPEKEVEFTYTLPEMPEGYEVVREDKLDDWHTVEFKGGNENIIIYGKVVVSPSMIMEIDTEGTQTETIIINGNKGIKYTNKGANHLIWMSSGYRYTLTGICEMSVLEEIAKNLK